MIPEPQLSSLREVARQKTAAGDFARNLLVAAGYALQPGNEALHDPRVPRAPKAKPEAASTPYRGAPEAKPEAAIEITPLQSRRALWVRLPLACIIAPCDAATLVALSCWAWVRARIVRTMTGECIPHDASVEADVRRASLLLRAIGWLIVVAWIVATHRK